MKSGVYLILALCSVICQANVISVSLKRQTKSEDNKKFISQNPNSHIDIESDLIQSYSYYNQTYSLNLLNMDKQQYVGNIVLGKQKQIFRVAVDTSSSFIMIPSKQCKQNNNCQDFSTFYDCQPNDGCTSSNQFGTYDYFNGQVSGTYANTLVTFASAQQVYQSILLFNQANQFTNKYSNGILGLGLGVYNQQYDPFVTSLYKSGQIQQNMFSLYVGYKLDDSELIFGGYNSQKMVQDAKIYYHRIAQASFQQQQKWAISISDFQLSTFKYYYSQARQVALIDSSFPYIGIEQGMYQQLYQYLINRGASVTTNNQLKINCNNTLSNMIFRTYDTSNIVREYQLPFSFYTNNQTLDVDCQLLIQPFSSNDNVAFVLGTPFLRRFVSIYSYQNYTIGFAQSIADPNDDFPVWAIVVIVIAGVLILGGAIGFYFWKKRKNRY